MSVSSHLGIKVQEYDSRIRTFIPRYEEILDAAAAALAILLRKANPVVVDLGIGSGALSERCVTAKPAIRVIGIDADPQMMAMARTRLGARLTPVEGDFGASDLPRCDGIMASFALHHVRTRNRKAALYRRCFKTLARHGVLISADCYLASNLRVRQRDRLEWRQHLERNYTRKESEAFLRAWGKEDVYFTLEDEIDLLRSAGFSVDVPWRHASFAVIAAVKA